MSLFGFPPRGPRFRWRGWEDFGAPHSDPPAGPGAGPGDDDDDGNDDDDRGPSSARGWDNQGRGASFGRLELYRRSFTKRIETGEVARLRVENRNGRITVRSHDEPVVLIAVEAEIYGASPAEADEEMQRIDRGITSDGNRVSAVVPDLIRPEWFFFGRGPKVDYDIRVPRDTDVWASNRNGAISIASIKGRTRAEGRNGRITIDEVGGDIEVESRNGRVTVNRGGGGARVSSTNGPISLERVQREVEVETRNGPVELIDLGAGVKAKTTNGPIKFQGRVNGDLDLEASNGSVRVAVTADSRFEIDAESRHGSTRSDLPVRDRKAPEEGAPSPPRVKIRTMNGSIRLMEA